jgi:hypothetical protein
MIPKQTDGVACAKLDPGVRSTGLRLAHVACSSPVLEQKITTYLPFRPAQ